MSTNILFITLLVICIFSCIDSFQGRYPTGKNRPCCVGVSKNDVSSKIIEKTYYEQPARDPCVRALIFDTAKGPVCVDPKARWVKKKIAKMIKLR